MCLAALEMTYVFSAIAHAPKDVVASKMLPRAREELENLKTFKDKPEAWGNGQGYWDDYCLCRFLEGVCERYLAYPVRSDVLPPRMFLDPYYRTQTLYPKMVHLTPVPRNAQQPLSRRFYRTERRSRETIIWFSTLVCHPSSLHLH